MRPSASSATALKRMRATRRRATPYEVALRKLLFAKGLRYRVDKKVAKEIHSRPDIVFAGSRVAVYVDGCFWHGCSEHGTAPRANADWWAEKLAANKSRDFNKTRLLMEAGWHVERVWSHEVLQNAVDRILKIVRARSITR